MWNYSTMSVAKLRTLIPTKVNKVECNVQKQFSLPMLGANIWQQS